MKGNDRDNLASQFSSPQSGCGVAILGFGTVGQSVATILSERSNTGLRLTHVLNRNLERKKVDWLPSAVRLTEDIKEIISSDANIVVELMGGLQPAEDWIRQALAAGKSVVTANKQLIARSGPQLVTLAHQNGQELYYGASVAGGVPVISGLQNGLAGDELFLVRGILNGTCNYILSKMESQKVSFSEALQEAQKLGFAEADPTEDVDGLDARAKLTILARIGLHRSVAPEEIAVQSIRRIEAIDFEYANQLGCTIRQISRAELKPGSENAASRAEERPDQHETLLLASVGPALVELSSPLARVEGSQNLVATTGTYGGETTFGGHGAGGHPTAVAVVSDILAIALAKCDTKSNSKSTVETTPTEKSPQVSNDFVSKHYLRFFVRDQPGIIAALATALSKCAINIDAVLQMPGHPSTRLPFLITLQECQTSLVERALEQINKLDFMVEPCLHIPIL